MKFTSQAQNPDWKSLSDPSDPFAKAEKSDGQIPVIRKKESNDDELKGTNLFLVRIFFKNNYAITTTVVTMTDNNHNNNNYNN